MTLAVIIQLTHRDDPPIHYRFGSVLVSSPRLSEALDAFEIQTPSSMPGASVGGERPLRHSMPTSSPSCDRFWIASADRTLYWTHHLKGMSLSMPLFADCELQFATADSPVRIWIEPLGPITTIELTTLILGPLLPMAMVNEGIPLLHAAILESPDGLCLICGESGTGKSTISSHLAQLPGWRRLGDDIAWLERVGNTFCADIYPQLKLPNSGKRDDAAAPNRVSRMIVLERHCTAGGHHELIEVSAFKGAQIVMTLLRHSVAVRLYSPQQTAAQLARFAAWADILSKQCRCMKIQSIEDSDLVMPIADRILNA